MSIRFLNCASMMPWWPRWEVGAICLLVDTNQGPILVDTGLGLHDHESPSRVVRFFQPIFGIQHAPEECALHRVERLGIRPEEVHHIVLTHIHFDHAGGLPDFPNAKVHLHRREYESLRHPKTWIELFAHDPADFAHQPDWVLYDSPTESWMGFDAIRLPFTPRMYLIPLFGHTSGHCGVAIQEGEGWLFQAADALPLNTQFDLTPVWANRLILGPHIPRLRAFMAEHPEVHVLAAHTWRSFFKELAP
jgi:glyoxylase-like metal-dependent hydrolase (beta-lactamase superfamily II)